MTILKRLEKIAEGKCTGLLAEEAEILLEVVEALKYYLDNGDCHNSITKAQQAIAKLEADDA